MPAQTTSVQHQRSNLISFDILDSIRGIASLYVAIAHCRGSLWIGGNEFRKMFPVETWTTGDYFSFGFSMLTRLAVEFVIVFFLLSGFSIAHSLSKSQEALPFYKRRLVRIYPPYLNALVWAGVVFLATKAIYPQWYDGTYTSFSFIRTVQMNDYFEPSTILGNLFYMPGEGFITPFWSLTYEVIFYLLAPFLLRNVNIYVLISLLLFTLHLFSPGATGKLIPGRYLYEFLFVYNIYFAAGVFLYHKFDYIIGKMTKISRTLHLLLVIAALLLVYAVNFKMQTESSYSFIAAAVMGFLLITYFLRFQVRIPWLMKVGNYSYTLYITHLATIFVYLAIYWAVAHPTTPYILNYWVWMGAVPLCLGVAYLQYRLVESRSKQMLQRLRKKNQ